MVHDVAIIGTGGVGRMAHQLITDCNRASGTRYSIAGFYDDNPASHDEAIWGTPVVGNIDTLRKQDIDSVIIGIADPHQRSKVRERLPDRFDFPTLVHPTAWIPRSVDIGMGSLIYPHCSINFSATLNEFTQINKNSTVGHDTDLGRFATVSPGVNLGGNVTVGHRTRFGINSSTIHGIQIGDDVTIGAGATVTNDISAEETVVGTPARPIESR